MKMVNMKMDPKKREEMTQPSSIATDGPEYPWGLSVSLDHESLEKLGIEMPAVGETMTMQAKVRVTRCEESDSEGGGKHRSVGLQITDMALDGAAKKSDGKTADILFGEKK